MNDTTITKIGEIGEKVIKDAGKGLKGEIKQAGKALLGQISGTTQINENSEVSDEELKKQQLIKRHHQAAQEMGTAQIKDAKPPEEETDEKDQSKENPPLTPLEQTNSKTPIGMTRHGTRESTKGLE